MAEPVSALPSTSPPSSTTGNQAVPRPIIVEPLRDVGGLPSQAEKLRERFQSGLGRSYDQVSDTLLEAWKRSRRKFHEISREHPLQLVIGVAVAAFVAGAALRIWRSNHD